MSETTNQVIAEDVTKTVEQYKDWQIETAEDYMAAGALLKAIKEKLAKVDAHHKPMVDQAHQLHKSAIAARDALTKPLKAIGSHVRAECGRWDTAQREIARKAQAEADRIARKKADDEQLAEAERLEAEGHAAAAEAVLEVPVAAPVAPVVPPAPKPAGISYRENWKAELVDFAAVPRDYLMVNWPEVNRVAKISKGEVEIPGFRIYSERTTAVR